MNPLSVPARLVRAGIRLRRLLAAVALATLLSSPGTAAAEEGEWQSLFNGENLDGWIAKVNHHPIGDNAHQTFVASDGVLHVQYDDYGRFYDEFAHITYEKPFESYRLRLEYRFVGEDTPGGPPWSKRNSGVMIYGQSPQSIGEDQPFPVSIEVQLLNGTARDPITTGNICTPGTNVAVGGERVPTHCINSTSRPYTGEAWVALEIEVHAGKTTVVRVDDIEVARFDQPQLDPTDLRAMPIYLDTGLPDPTLRKGYISLQGEGHPIDFRNIRIQPLSE